MIHIIIAVIIGAFILFLDWLRSVVLTWWTKDKQDEPER